MDDTSPTVSAEQGDAPAPTASVPFVLGGPAWSTPTARVD